ncbi:hypothetical protein EGT74_26995 [Chitinophaga lutea]|uniref:Uncharacterized protein n=1 Tax=Chitinophaga lutea TaxID=2488634 RepID=A0A3N4PHF2_9BACT|nr:hypothetical protein [Chitinophaga lutea]RPE05999.1 hypothetical protein EGT74_26995 [Chitinophaga lutea]
MPEQYIQTRFESICGEHDTWIVAYDSAAFGVPLYFVWYTDNKGGDKLLTFNNHEIFAVTALEELAGRVREHLPELQAPPKLQRWLDAVGDLQPETCNTYSVDRIARQIRSKKLSLDALDGLSNFIDLFGDYANSLHDTAHLAAFRENRIIESLIGYYYQHIFWPRLNDQEQFPRYKRPPLEIDHSELLRVFTGMKEKMEAVIRIL